MAVTYFENTVTNIRAEALKELYEAWRKVMLKELREMATMYPRPAPYDDLVDSQPFVLEIEPPWIRNMNSSQRRRTYRHLTKKWETQIAVHQVKARLAGQRATSSDVLAIQMETADQEQRRRNRQAVRTSAKVAGPRFSDGRGL